MRAACYCSMVSSSSVVRIRILAIARTYANEPNLQARVERIARERPAVIDPCRVVWMY